MPEPVEVGSTVLQELAPPPVQAAASKHDRGTALVVGGSAETPGAVLLAGLAALRAGAGRLRIAFDGPAAALAVAVPEARVCPLDKGVADLAVTCSAALVGSGSVDADVLEPWLDLVTSSLRADAALVVDAGALPIARRHPEWIRRLGGRALLLPNASELGALGARSGAEAAERFDAVVAVRGPTTTIATPTGERYVDRRGNAGLATSGSGDVAGGLALGLAARGGSVLGAAAWAMALHGRAGERLGGPGFLARELLDEIPGAWRDLDGHADGNRGF